ncbi:hypothetical protein [Sphingorhabdus pulchriflava]|uniref:hypothetical protein n=1 Tax=Sphingorhabdus pulchriflava TaxID=2292257 RepID=UPI0011C04BE8|nr:hypothetical protein [Sphingorhabdus pulchriflava]
MARNPGPVPLIAQPIPLIQNQTRRCYIRSHSKVRASRLSVSNPTIGGGYPTVAIKYPTIPESHPAKNRSVGVQIPVFGKGIRCSKGVNSLLCVREFPVIFAEKSPEYLRKAALSGAICSNQQAKNGHIPCKFPQNREFSGETRASGTASSTIYFPS